MIFDSFDFETGNHAQRLAKKRTKHSESCSFEHKELQEIVLLQLISLVIIETEGKYNMQLVKQNK